MTGSPILEATQLTSGYGKKQVIFPSDLVVEEGQFLGIVGPNGSGKSTLLKTLFGMVTPWSGDIRFQGNSILNWSPAKKVANGFSIVIQGGRAFPDLSVRDNLLLGGQAFMHKHELDAQVHEMEERFPVLGLRRQQLASQLSGGERQQLALARSLIARPRLLLLDEPSLGLSPSLVQSVFKSIAALRGEGVTVVVVEQNVQAAIDVVDRLIIMRDGSIVNRTDPQSFLGNIEMVETFLG